MILAWAMPAIMLFLLLLALSMVLDLGEYYSHGKEYRDYGSFKLWSQTRPGLLGLWMLMTGLVYVVWWMWAT